MKETISFLLKNFSLTFLLQRPARHLLAGPIVRSNKVGYASLGFGIAAIVAHKSNTPAPFIAILGPSLFVWGAAAGHVVLWTDILLSVIGFALLYFFSSTQTRVIHPV
jgi:hypothetical protein